LCRGCGGVRRCSGDVQDLQPELECDLFAAGHEGPLHGELNLSGPRFQHPGNKCVPLIVATAGGHIEIVQMILELAPKTAVDHMDGDGVTALLVAAQTHRADIPRLLADHGANVNYVDQRRTPLRLAVGRIPLGDNSRDPDPDGARQVATVLALLRLGAGTSPPPPSRPPRNLLVHRSRPNICVL